jgi:hypothetical protein
MEDYQEAMKLMKQEMERFLKVGLEQQWAAAGHQKQISHLSVIAVEVDEDGYLSEVEIEIVTVPPSVD